MLAPYIISNLPSNSSLFLSRIHLEYKYLSAFMLIFPFFKLNNTMNTAVHHQIAWTKKYLMVPGKLELILKYCSRLTYRYISFNCNFDAYVEENKKKNKIQILSQMNFI